MRGVFLGCGGLLLALMLGCGGDSDSSNPEIIEEDPPSFKGITVDERIWILFDGDPIDSIVIGRGFR